MGITKQEAIEGYAALCGAFNVQVSEMGGLVWGDALADCFTAEEFRERIMHLVRTSRRMPTVAEVICTTDEAETVTAKLEQKATRLFADLMTYPRRCIDYDPRIGSVMSRGLVQEQYGTAAASAFTRCGGDATFASEEKPWQRKEFVESFVRDSLGDRSSIRREALKASEQKALTSRRRELKA